MGFLTRYDGELRETLFRSQGSQVSMRMAMGSGSLLSSHGRGIGPQDAITSSRSLLKLMSIKSVMPSNHLIVCLPLLFLPSIFPSIRVFQMSQFFTSGGLKIGVSASASVLPNSGLISFRIDWFDLLAVQGTLKNLLPIP